jgi:hypothetical protein
LELIPEIYKPKSVFIPKKRDFENIIKDLNKQAIDYPLIIKPDIGFRGMLVQKIHSDNELKRYLEAYPINLIIQEFITLPNECGIFYHRLPNNKKGTISSLTVKSFLSVQGDGFSTLSELISYDNRAQHYSTLLKKDHKDSWDSIIDKNKTILLSDIGNHCKGTQFINGNHLIDKELENTLDKLNAEIDGWYYGRLDIKYNTIEELRKGKSLKILEINGIIAEPTHIYDPYHNSYFQALSGIREHWRFLYAIAMQNIQNGIPTKSFTKFWSEIRWLSSYIKKVERLSKMQR